MIGFAFDYTNVASLLAFDPTCALADELGVEIQWLPFPSGVRSPSKPLGGEESVSERHTRVRAEYFARDTARYAAWRGIELNRDADGVDSSLACAGGLWATRHGVARDYNRHVLTEFWAGRLDIEDPEALAAVLDRQDAPGFESFDFVGPLAEHRAAVAARGAFNVPAYLVEDEIFVGRAHLPMIRWILQGRDGPGPL